MRGVLQVVSRRQRFKCTDARGATGMKMKWAVVKIPKGCHKEDFIL